MRGRDVIAAVLAGCEGTVEYRALPSRQRAWVAPDDLAAAEAFVAAHATEHVYFGVASRRPETGRGTRADCVQLGALFADLDCKTRTLNEARATLDRVALPPSIVVASGGGLHVYYLLREPLDVQADPAGVTTLLRRLAGALDGDLAAAEPARVLRVPGTRNPKYDPARLVTVEGFAPDRRYNPSEIADALPALAAGPSPTGPALALDAPIGEGQRNPTLYRLARSLRAKALPAVAVRDAVQSVNAQRCTPPLAAAEVDALIDGALRQPDRADYVTLAEPARARETTPYVLPALTPTEIAALQSERTTFLAPYLAKGAITEFDGYVKKGKSSFLLYVVGCLIHGEPCLDQPTIQTPCVWLTEERLPTFRAGLERSGLLAAPHLFCVSRWTIPRDLAWPALVEAAVRRCQAEGAGLLVVDTLPQWAGLLGDDENNAGAALAALAPLQWAAADGLAIALTRHDRKGGGAVGESGRGSSAFSGAVDTIVSLKKPEGRHPATHRLLEAVSRFDGVPEALVIDRPNAHVPTGSGFDKHLYRPLGDPGALATRTAHDGILDALRPGQSCSADDLKAQLADVAPATLARALKGLLDTDKIVREGAGKKGDPYRYARGAEVASQTSNPRGRDDKHFPETPIAPPLPCLICARLDCVEPAHAAAIRQLQLLNDVVGPLEGLTVELVAGAKRPA